MSETVGDYIIKRLSEWGVKRIFGYPGDGINGIIGAFQKDDCGIQFIQARHEEMAAFMACAHAKFTGEVGVCLATSGPGAIHLLNGLYDAKKDNQPVVAIVGQSPRIAIGSDFQQEVDIKSLYKDVASEYLEEASVPGQMRHLLDRAMRIAKAERTVTCIIVPKDLQELEAVEHPKRKLGSTFSGVGYHFPKMTPQQADLQQAADILNAGKKIAILVGAGAKNAESEVIDLAEKLGAGVAKALLGKDVLSDYLPYVTGAIGLLGTKPSWDMMQQCDTFLMIGSNFPYAEFLPKEGQARGIQIDIQPRMLSLRYPMDVSLQGDSAETIQALLPLLETKTDRSWREAIEANVKTWWEIIAARAENPGDPINPEYLFTQLSDQLPDNAIITVDTGTATFWYARDIKLRSGMKASVSGSLATMGAGVPYAIAAKFAFPDRPVIALVGDGAMQMNGSSELLTVAKYWQSWSDPRFIVLVLNNHDLNYVTWEMRAMSGNPKFETSQDLPDFSYAMYAESLGFKGISLKSPDLISTAWTDAFNSNCPVVIDAYVDGDIPPLPPHISLEQAHAMANAMLKGDSNAWDIIRKSLQEVMKDVLVTATGRA